MKKLTRKCLDEMAKELSVIEKVDQTVYLGGGSGTVADPFTVAELDLLMDSGRWHGGYVDGMGFVQGAVICTPTGNYTDFGQFAASIAEGYNAISESNNGDLIEWFLGFAGITNGTSSTPWCAAFMSAVFTMAGISNPQSAAVDAWRTWGSATTNVAVGDVAIFNSGSHMGIVSAVNGDMVTVVHGNYGDMVQTTQESISDLTFRTRE